MGTLFTFVLLLLVACSVLWSVFVRKLVKTRIRSISVIACVVLAFVGTVIFKQTVLDPGFVKETILPLISSSVPAEAIDLINASTVLFETAIGLPVALITPLVFVALYTVLYILATVVYAIVMIFVGRKAKKSEKNDVPYAEVRGLAWSLASAALSLVVVLLPVAFYGGLIDDSVDAIAQSNLLDAETQAVVEDISKEFVDPIFESAPVQMFRMLGGDAMIDSMTVFTVKGETICINDEIATIAELVGEIVPLVNASNTGEWGAEEADRLVVIANTFSKSNFLTVVSSEAVYFLTDGIVNGDEPMELADNELFGGLVNRLIVIVHDDAKNTKQFTANLNTIAEMASILIKGGVISNMEDTDALMDELAGGSTIKDVIIVLGKNSSMKYLIPEVTNIGIKAIASAIEVEEDADALYNELMNTIAADLNAVRDLDDAAKVSELSPKLLKAFDDAGLVIDKQVIDLYSVAMIQGILSEAGDEEIVAEDVQSFFVTYAWGVEQFENGTMLISDARTDSAPAILARMILAISDLNVKDADFDATLAEILEDNGFMMLHAKEGALYEAVIGVTLKKNLDSAFAQPDSGVTEYDYTIQEKFYTTSTVASTVALQSAQTMKEKSLLIFMDEIVIDVDEAAKLITDETVQIEAEAIGGIFSKAGSLMNDLSGEEINIGTMATSVGSILNSFRNSISVGEERTTNLFIAIIQSSMVRDTANMDIGTATQLGVKGTQKNADGTPVDYERTFKTISNTMDVLQNMNSSTEEGMTQEALSTVLKDLNPQTAGMIESYITEERLTEDYGVSEEYSATAAPLISDVFGYMGSADMTEEECTQEAEALNDVMTLVTSASDKANSGESSETVFGGENSVLGKSADDTVATFMASESIKHSLNNNADSLGDDPFGMGDMMVQDGETDEKKELEDAMKNYYANTEYETEEEKAADKETLTNLGKLFGFTTEEMDYILGE